MQRLHDFIAWCSPRSPVPARSLQAAPAGAVQLGVTPTAGTTDSDAQAEEGIARRGRGRPRGSGRKPPTGAAAIAQQLKTIGIAGRFMNTNGMVAALGFDADEIAHHRLSSK